MHTYSMEWIIPIVVFIFISSSLQETRFKLHGPVEYCIMDSMNITCGGQSVIVIDSALYGLMAKGRCAKNTYGNGDCSNDVMSILDAVCSGQQTCALLVPQPEMYNMYKRNPRCPQELAPYLEITYRCIQAHGGRKQCDESRSVKLTGSSGFISAVGQGHAAGSSHCPWYIRVDPTQKLKITLYNFLYGAPEVAAKLGNSRNAATDGCYDAATIREQGRSRILRVCYESDPRAKVYRTSTNEIYLEVDHRRISNYISFLIKYEAEGCPELKAQQHAWMTKDPDGTVRIRCNYTDETWFLTCKDNTWLGEVGNCTIPRPWGLIDLFGTGHKFPYGILIVIGIGVVLGVIIGGLLLLCVIAYSRKFGRFTRKEGQETSEILENKSVVNSRYTSHNIASRPPLPPPPPPPPPPLPDSFRTRPMPPCGLPPPQEQNVRDSLIRCSVPSSESSTHYGSAAVTSFTTFGRRQHLYECPEFT